MSDLLSVGIVTMFDVLKYTAYITNHGIIDDMRFKKKKVSDKGCCPKSTSFDKKDTVSPSF